MGQFISCSTLRWNISLGIYRKCFIYMPYLAIISGQVDNSKYCVIVNLGDPKYQPLVLVPSQCDLACVYCETSQVLCTLVTPPRQNKVQNLVHILGIYYVHAPTIFQTTNVWRTSLFSWDPNLTGASTSTATHSCHQFLKGQQWNTIATRCVSVM